MLEIASSMRMKQVRIASEVNLQTLTDDAFAGLCHALLFEEHGTSYKPVAGDGGDSGVDGFVNDYEIVYQFKFFKARPRPSSFLKDIDKVQHLSNMKRWMLILPEDPTQRLYQLIAKEKASRPFIVDALGKTWICSMLAKHKHIRERFFPEIAKEASVQKVISMSEFRAKKQDQSFEEMKKEVRSRKPVKVSAERPANSLTQEHIRIIKDEIKKISDLTRGKDSYSKICSKLKNKNGVDNWYWISDDHYPEIMDWLRKYYYGAKSEYQAPGDIRRQLIGVIKSQQKQLRLSDKIYRELLLRVTGKKSSTVMEIAELRAVVYHFNILLGQ